MTHADALRTLAAERYLLDEMPEIEKFAFEEHFFDCAECADDLRAGSAMRAGVKAAPSRPAAIPMVPVRRRWTPAVVVPWAAAAMLALAVGYQSLAPGRGGRLQIGTHNAGDDQARQSGSGADGVHWQRCQRGDIGAGRRRAGACGSDIHASNLSRVARRGRSNHCSAGRIPASPARTCLDTDPEHAIQSCGPGRG